MKFKKMLFVTNFDELWFDALESLMGLRKAGLDHVVFLHVINREQVAMHRGKGYLKEEDIRLKQMADMRFIDWAESVFEKGMECGAYVVVGDPLPKILSTAETEGVNLIVTESYKRTKLEKMFASSTTMDLLRRSKTPVLVHKYMLQSGKLNDKPFETPLLVTDWSSPCERALEQLIDIKKAVKNVVVIHVVSDDVVKGKSKDDLLKIQKENKQRLKDICTTFEQEGVKADFHLCMGDVVSQIEIAAHEHNATMVVMGSTGKGAWRARWLGSISQKVTETSEFPTMLIP